MPVQLDTTNAALWTFPGGQSIGSYTQTILLSTSGPQRLVILWYNVPGNNRQVTGGGLLWQESSGGGYWFAYAPHQLSEVPISISYSGNNNSWTYYGWGIVDTYSFDNANTPEILYHATGTVFPLGGSTTINLPTYNGGSFLSAFYASPSATQWNQGTQEYEWPITSLGVASPFQATSSELPPAGTPGSQVAVIGAWNPTMYSPGQIPQITLSQTGCSVQWDSSWYGLCIGVPASSSSGFSYSSSSSGASSLSSSSSTSPSSSSTSPSSSSASPSPSLFPAGDPRQCVRLAHPDWRTTEGVSGDNLVIGFHMPIEIFNKWWPKLPNNGPDAVTIHYSDMLGQPWTYTFDAILWMSDSGYAFLSADQSTQFLIAGVDGAFFDANAAAVNARNVLANAPPLAPCANPRRYDDPRLLPNQVRPVTWIRDGILEASSSSA